jgi:hypothetical protein
VVLYVRRIGVAGAFNRGVIGAGSRSPTTGIGGSTFHLFVQDAAAAAPRLLTAKRHHENPTIGRAKCERGDTQLRYAAPSL